MPVGVSGDNAELLNEKLDAEGESGDGMSSTPWPFIVDTAEGAVLMPAKMAAKSVMKKEISGAGMFSVGEKTMPTANN